MAAATRNRFQKTEHILFFNSLLPHSYTQSSSHGAHWQWAAAAMTSSLSKWQPMRVRRRVGSLKSKWTDCWMSLNQDSWMTRWETKQSNETTLTQGQNAPLLLSIFNPVFFFVGRFIKKFLPALTESWLSAEGQTVLCWWFAACCRTATAGWGSAGLGRGSGILPKEQMTDVKELHKNKNKILASNPELHSCPMCVQCVLCRF